MKAAMGANGVDVNTGSNVNVLASQREANQLSAEPVLANAQQAAWGYQLQEEGDANQVQLYRAQAKNDQTAGMIKAVSGVVGGLGSVFSPSTGLFGSASPVANDDLFDGVTDEMIMGG
jgi:hypothetical protein